MNTISTIQTSIYPVMEHFATLQGEGFHAGKPAYFIRTGGCDVGCHWCDVKESWPESGHKMMGADELAELAVRSELDIVVITGGEPTMHNLDELCLRLSECGKQLHIETSGTNKLTGQWDWITFSPKKFKAPLPEIYDKAHELKVIIFNASDFAFAEEHAARTNRHCLLFLQPEWSKRDSVMPMIVEYIKTHPKWRISLQTHKYLNIP